ncbi:MAG: family 16 glycosylhydrolase [Candidatus Omnitrophota bacterium]
MKKRCLIYKSLPIVFLAAGLFLISGITVYAQTTPREIKENWCLLWQDEFEGESLDLTKWRIEDAALFKNNELQYYTPEDVYLQDGVLVLRSQKRLMKGRQYTSGLVETIDRFARQYGYFEIRAKLPKGKGLWAAHWMLPASGEWPPEIDIMELLGHSPNTIYTTHHWGIWPNKKHQASMYTGPDFSDDFHTFALAWTPQELCWYVDGVQCFLETDNIPQEPFYLILNTAVGGNWPGSPNSATEFPQYHEIDYVRIYAKEVPGAYFLTTYTQNGHITADPQQEVYKEGDSVSLTVSPSIGYEFSHWSGDLTGRENPAIIKMNAHKQIKAHFVVSPGAPHLISQNKQVSSSTVESAQYPPESAVDGNPDTRWSSHFADSQWIQIDLGETYWIKAVRLSWEVAYATTYEIQVSENAVEWQTIYSTQNGKGKTEEITNLNAPARYISMYAIERGTEFGHSLWEFEVFGRECKPRH